LKLLNYGERVVLKPQFDGGILELAVLSRECTGRLIPWRASCLLANNWKARRRDCVHVREFAVGHDLHVPLLDVQIECGWYGSGGQTRQVNEVCFARHDETR
jgi:hypothetical protein